MKIDIDIFKQAISSVFFSALYRHVYIVLVVRTISSNSVDTEVYALNFPS